VIELMLDVGDDPLVVGLFGEWGVGKSTLLAKILEHAFTYENGRIDARKSGFGNARFGLTVPVVFQPWKYEHEEYLHVPLLLHILEALKRDLKASATMWQKCSAATNKTGDWVASHIATAVDVFEKLVTGAAVATAPATTGASLAAIPLMSAAKGLAAKLPGLRKSKTDLPGTVRYSDEGRYFYEIHEHLRTVTRPAQKKNHDKGYTQGQQSENDSLAINFVVFVDDLDRCLPEKAVAVLELIKTVFNVESFAFVLALDDEVIERGIGHRYKDYALQNKKPKCRLPVSST
jgi:KAP family P-loop domain